MTRRFELAMDIRRHRRYVTVDIDWVRQAWRLTREGQAVIATLLAEAAHETFRLGRRGSRAIAWLASATELSISAIDRRIADDVLFQIVEVLRHPAFRLPRR